MIGRNGDEAGIADHIDENFHPYGHDAAFPRRQTPRGRDLFLHHPMIRPARSHGPRVNAFATCFAAPTSDVDAVLVLSPLARLPHLIKNADNPTLFLRARDPRHIRKTLPIGDKVPVPSQRQNEGRPDPLTALARVVSQYSSRSRSNFFWVSLKRATRAAISARSRASRSSFSVFAIRLLV